MADLLKASIGVEFKGQAGINQAVQAIGKTEVALKKMTPATGQATGALINLGRVAQDAPYGIIGIANNLNPLLESFQRTAKEAGGFTGALKALGASLLGGGGIGLLLSVATGAMSYFAMGSRKAKEEVDLQKEAVEKAAEEQRKFNSAIDAASSAIVNQSDKLRDLKGILVDTGSQLEELSKQTVNQAVTQYLFTQKRELLEKLIGEKLKQQLDTGEKILKSAKGFQLTGNEAFGRETEVSLERINRLAKVLGVTFNDVFNKTFSKGAASKIDNFKPFSGPLFSGNIEIKPPPDDETKRAATEFGQMFYEEVNKYLGRQVIDLGLDKAVADAKAKEAFNKGIQGILQSGLQNLKIEGLSSLGEAIGTALSGGDLKGVFSNFLNILGSGIQAIGKQIIALSVTAKSVKTALKTIFTNPAAAIVAGVGLIAVGAAIKGIASKGIAGARALGGPIGSGRSYLVGERGPELFTPGISGNIVPNNRIGGLGGSFGGGGVTEFRLRGTDLVAVMANTNRSQIRLA